MADPFLSEIRIFSFGHAPIGWAMCNGQLMPINQNQALFALLGTTYGGNGQTTFALPNLQGRVPEHVGNGHLLGEQGGEQTHTLTSAELPTHFHTAQASTNTAGSTPIATNNFLTEALNVYRSPNSLTTLNPGTVSVIGGSQAHLNMQPFLVLNFCIALLGIFPSQN